MILQKLLFATVAVCFTAGIVSAQSPDSRDTQSRMSLFDAAESPSGPTSPSDLRRSTATAAELRQQRALYQMQQRIERLEAAAWLGYNPLRPNWSAIPMMSSRYAPTRIVYVPVYVR